MKCRMVKTIQFWFLRCVCVEPSNPGNETLKVWEERNVTAHNIPWGNLTVSVSICEVKAGANSNLVI